MDIDEIKRYIHVGVGYVEVSREYMYNGLCRRTFIRENQIQLDFCTAGEIELNEGETTFYFGYENFEDVIKAAEKFLEKPVSEWTNYNRTWNEWYFPETPDKNYVRNFFSDLQQRKLIFPENFRYMRICSIYALGVFIGKISPDNITADIDLTEFYRMNHDFTEY
ncbi:MAG: hypothetical protein K2K89_08760 [Ruminococcus sp.]|nr:hypothetical protein [Ruminococcus sp.]